MTTESNTPLTVRIDPLKYLDRLPEFSGDCRDLQTFINLIDRVFPILRAYDEPSQYLFSDIIKSRVKGKAREILEINCQAQSWTDIKAILINNFGERLSVEELFDRLKSSTFKTNSVEFYNDIKHRLRSLNNKTIIILGSGPAANECAKNNMRTALNVFKEKIPEPMKTILTCRNPETLEAAMEILFQSGYAYTPVSNGIFATNGKQTNKTYNPNQSNNSTGQDNTDKKRQLQPQYENKQQKYNYQNNNPKSGSNQRNQYNNNPGNQYNNNQRNHFQPKGNQQYNFNRNQTSQPNGQYQQQYQQTSYRPNDYQGSSQAPHEPMDINLVENNTQPNSQDHYVYENNQDNRDPEQAHFNYQENPDDFQSFQETAYENTMENPNQDIDPTPQNFHIHASRESYPI